MGLVNCFSLIAFDIAIKITTGPPIEKKSRGRKIAQFGGYILTDTATKIHSYIHMYIHMYSE